MQTRTFSRPKLFISKCLGFAACRFNGQVINDKSIELMLPYVDVVTACPECEIGLGVPRAPIRLVRSTDSDAIRLQQPSTGRDVTEAMTTYTCEYLNSLEPVDGFVLKSRSPSCGWTDVKVYRNLEKGAPIGHDRGLFGRAVREQFPTIPIEDEGRLHNFTLRENFLTRIFTLAEFRQVEMMNTMGALVDFHTRNKYLLGTYKQQSMRKLGALVANAEKLPASEVIGAYRAELHEAMRNPPSPTEAINMCMHGLGYFKNDLDADEKQFFLDCLEEYRVAKVPLSVPLHLLRAWVVRFHCEYLAQQTFFEPYPEALIEISDSGKGRSVK